MGTDVSGGYHPGPQGGIIIKRQSIIIIITIMIAQHGIVEVTVEGNAELKTIKVVSIVSILVSLSETAVHVHAGLY